MRSSLSISWLLRVVLATGSEEFKSISVSSANEFAVMEPIPCSLVFLFLSPSSSAVSSTAVVLIAVDFSFFKFPS